MRNVSEDELRREWTANGNPMSTYTPEEALKLCTTVYQEGQVVIVPESKVEGVAKVSVKYDTGKLRWGLLPVDAMRCILKVIMFGAAKYGERNWEEGMEWNRYYNACQRHLTDWWECAPEDTESHFSHLWHAGCCILFLIAYELRGVGTDDRPNINSREKRLDDLRVIFQPAHGVGEDTPCEKLD